MHPLAASIIRTLVPIIVGALLGWAARVGFNLDNQGQTELDLFITAALTGLYYIVVRLVEEHVPAVGWLLGLAKAPTQYEAKNGRHETTN